MWHRAFVVSGLILLAGCPSKKDAERQFQVAILKMTEFRTRMCECKDKACADKVQEDMTAWAQQMAKDAPTAKSQQPSEDQIKKMTEAATLYSECMVKAMGANDPIAVEPIHDDVPAASVPPASTSHNADDLLREARTWAAQKQPQHRIANADIQYVEENGNLDEEYGELELTFGRAMQSVDDSKRKIGAPVPQRPDPDDCFQLRWRRTVGWSRTAHGCSEAGAVALRCSVAQIWKRAASRDAPHTALASIDVDTTSKVVEWEFRILDEPRQIDIRESFVDDCPLAVEK